MTVLLLFLPPILAGLSASFFVEQRLNPKPVWINRRPLPALQLHIGTWLVLFAIVLLLVLRPWFAVVMLLAFQLLLVLVNHAKFASLREPFIFQDFEYFTDAIRHPRLYLPFFGIGRTLAATLGFVSALVIGVMLEAPITGTLSLWLSALLWLMIVSIGLLLLRLGLANCPEISFNPGDDLQKLGQIAFFWAYWRAEKRTEINSAGSFFQESLPVFDDKQRPPHIVAVQSESFFDPRFLSDNIKDHALEHFDQIKREATYFGRLQVPAWGANTVRTECAFLTGLVPGQLGIHQFNPYRSLAKLSIPNLVDYLKKSGYRTVCIHPYPASFYLRNQVFPRMGFDRFIDIADFTGQEKVGQYIGDDAVSRRVIELLSGQDAVEKSLGEGPREDQGEDRALPLFIFVITMENHGPLHLEQVEQTDNERYYRQTPVAGSEDMTVYLRHLKNADLMIKRLKDCLKHCADSQQAARPGVLCWYGDHVPIMTGVYQKLGEPDGLTDYFIWETNRLKPAPEIDLQTAGLAERQLAVHELSALMITSIIHSL